MIKKNLLFIKGAAINLAYKVKDSAPLPWLFLGQVAALSLGIAGLVIGVKTSNSLLSVKEGGKDITSPLLNAIRKDNKAMLTSLNGDLSKWVNEFKEGNSSNLDYLKFFINKQEVDNVSFVRSLDHQSNLIATELKEIKDAVKALDKFEEDLNDIKKDVKGVATDVNTLTTNVDEFSEAITSTKQAVDGMSKTVAGWNLYMSSKLNNVKEELAHVIESKSDQLSTLIHDKHNELTQYIDETSEDVAENINKLMLCDEIKKEIESMLSEWFNAFIWDLQTNWVLEIKE